MRQFVWNVNSYFLGEIWKQNVPKCRVLLFEPSMQILNQSMLPFIFSCKRKSKGWIALKWQILRESNKFQVSFCSPFKFVRRFFVEKKNELQRKTKALISLRGRAGWSAPLLFAHILRRVFSATLAIDQAQVALLLYGQLFNGVLIYTHWNIGSTFVCGWIRNWLVVKVTFSKTVRGNEEWQIESVIKKTLCRVL